MISMQLLLKLFHVYEEPEQIIYREINITSIIKLYLDIELKSNDLYNRPVTPLTWNWANSAAPSVHGFSSK